MFVSSAPRAIGCDWDLGLARRRLACSGQRINLVPIATPIGLLSCNFTSPSHARSLKTRLTSTDPHDATVGFLSVTSVSPARPRQFKLLANKHMSTPLGSTRPAPQQPPEHRQNPSAILQSSLVLMPPSAVELDARLTRPEIGRQCLNSAPQISLHHLLSCS